jgi:hypothetical protein
MSRQYHLRAFLRDAPNVFLRRYLAEKGLGLALDWGALGETEYRPIFDAVQEADQNVRAQCEADFCEIDRMATDGGVKTLLVEARFHGHDLASAFGEAEDDHERAFWVFLEYPRVFLVARERYRADNLPGRSWRTRTGLASSAPRTDQPSRDELGKGIAEHFQITAGKGHHWKVEHYDGDDRLYWFVYTQDYAGADTEFSEEGEFQRRTRLRADEVIFVYHKAERALDLYSPGCSPKTVEVLRQVWADAVLGGDLGTPTKGGIVFELDGLKQRGFAFHFDPADGIEEVRLTKLRLAVSGGSRAEEETNPRMTLEVNARKNPEAIYDLLDRIVGERGIPPESVRVTQARFRFVFRSSRRGGTETLSFDVTYPDLCSLKQDPKHKLARDYLRRWGIDVSGSTETDSEAD